MKKILLSALAVLIAWGAVCAEDNVNLKYLKSENKLESSADWDKGLITLKGNGKTAVIGINVPFIISGNTVVNLENPPFTEKGEVYLPESAAKIIRSMIAGERKPQQVKTAAKPAQAAVATATPKPAATAAPTPEPVKAEAVDVEPEIVAEHVVTGNEKPSKPKKSGDKIIVIDAGHGGDDPGAVGPTGLKEKQVVWGVALRAAYYLKQYKGFKVYLTRDEDKFISLKQRAVFANNLKADLFVSVHCNASRNRGAKGTRTYIYSRTASSREAEAAAKYENKSAGTFEMLLNDLRKGAFEYLSIEAAGYIQHALARELKFKWEPSERAPFYVLANTNMPSVLVETFFISNPKEEAALGSTYFRDSLARGICDGIVEYFDRMN